MNSFDINRFGRALRWMISVNFRSLLMWTLGLTLGVAMGELMVRAMIQTTTPQETHTTGILGGFFVVYIIIGVVVGIACYQLREVFGSNRFCYRIRIRDDAPVVYRWRYAACSVPCSVLW